MGTITYSKSLNIVIFTSFFILTFPSNSKGGIGDTLYIDFPSVTDHFSIGIGDDLIYTREIIGSDPSQRGGSIIQRGGWNRIEPHISSSGDLIQNAELRIGVSQVGDYNIYDGYLRVHGDISVGYSDIGFFDQNGGSVWIESHPTTGLGGDLILARNDTPATGGYPLAYYNLDGGDLTAEREFIGGSNDPYNTRYAGAEFTQTGGFNRATVGLYIGNSVDAWGEYNLSGGSIQAREELVGYAGRGTLNHTGGTNHVEGSLIIAHLPDSTGTYRLNNGGVLTVNNTTVVGNTGNGTFTLGSYGTHRTDELLVSRSVVSDGTYTIEEHGTLEVAGTETIGISGSGSFHQNGGTNTTNILAIGLNSGASGEYFLSGGNLAADTEIIGQSGSGSFSQFEGSTNTTTSMILGQETDGYGLYYLLGGSLSTENVDIRQGNFRQTRGSHSVSNQLQIGSNGSSMIARYELVGGALDVNRRATIGPDGMLTYSGGTFNANFLYNNGTVNFIGGSEPLVFNGIIDNLEDATFNMNRAQTQTERAEIEYNGALELARNSHLNIYNTNLDFNGIFNNNDGIVNIVNSDADLNSNENNYGTINVINSEVDWGSFSNHGDYISESSLNYFEDLTIGDTGYLVGSDLDSFLINGDFINRSTEYDLWNTVDAYLGFNGEEHLFVNQIIDEFADEFLWGTIELLEGELLLQGTDLYVENLLLSTNTLLTLDGITVYYNYLIGDIENISFLNGGRLAAVPEPSTLLLMATGLAGLGFAGRKQSKKV